MKALNWIDRAVEAAAPGWHLKRIRARAAATVLKRHYEAASDGRRTQGWRKPSTDVNAALMPSLARLRNVARDLVRNNPYAKAILDTIVDHTIGWGFIPTVQSERFNQWANSTACDADGRLDFAGLQALVMSTMVESGEVLVRRRWRRLEDGLPLPFQLQVLEPDFLDTLKDGPQPGGNVCVQGVEFDLLGRRVAYWLYKKHPGSINAGMVFGESQRISANDVLHVFRVDRPGQARGASWFAPTLLRFKDLDDYEDAQLVKQKIAACLSVMVTDPDGTIDELGTVSEGATASSPQIDSLEPGTINYLPPGRDVKVVDPPRVGEFKDYMQVNLRGIATGFGVTYEDTTGDYTNLPFSAARMSRLRSWARVTGWRWRTVVPQFLNPVWGWVFDAHVMLGKSVAATTDWDAPAMPMIEPDKEGLAILRNVRAGIQTLSAAIRERGQNPARHLEELAKDFAELDRLALVLDVDPRRMTQAGQAQGTAASAEKPGTAKPDATNDESAEA